MKWFIYAWDIDPGNSKIIGPFDSRADAINWLDDTEDDYENTGLMQLAFETFKAV